MAGRLENHSAVPPRPRSDPERVGFFHPREVAEIIGSPRIDYAQLRRLYRLARLQTGTPLDSNDRRWARYTLRDIAAVEVALELAGGAAALEPGRRLMIKSVEDAVNGLLTMGVKDPLLEVRMERQGSVIVAAFAGDLVEPASGQLVIRRIFSAAATQVDRRSEYDVVQAMREERDAKLRNVRRRVQLVQRIS